MMPLPHLSRRWGSPPRPSEKADMRLRFRFPGYGYAMVFILLSAGCAAVTPPVSPASRPGASDVFETPPAERPAPVSENDAKASPPQEVTAASPGDVPEIPPPLPTVAPEPMGGTPAVPELHGESEPPEAAEDESVSLATSAPEALTPAEPTSTAAAPADPAPTAPPEKSPQELLDSALDFCEASSDFWEKGDLDNALDALDQAYALILRVDPGTDPRILQQRDDLRIAISRRILECYSSRFIAAEGDHEAIPLVMNQHVEQAVKRLTGRDKTFFLASYRRSGRYRPAIVKALREAGMPEELSWLPLIESGFQVRALSRARALGLWQFIASTGYKYGLKRGPWVDERMDPEKSTAAAVAYLQELHQIFGDWTTVLAAYNCGETAVLRRIRTQRINYLDDFWDLYEKLPRETAAYVPKFLAVLHVLKDPQAFGITLPPVDAPFEGEEVTVGRPVHLRAIADRLELPLDSLEELNPALRRDATPDRPYGVRVPLGKGDLLRAELDELPAYAPPVPAYVVHRVRAGETLSAIAGRYRSSVRGIMAMNGLKRADYLKIGWNLKVPTRGGRTASTAPLHRERPTGQEVKYRVRRGDSLWEIARRFGTTVDAIRSLNGIRGTDLRVGQVLAVRRGSHHRKTPPAGRYQVVPGDSPALIAQRHRMNLSDFLTLNHLTPRSTIFPGQVLMVAE